MLYSLVIENLIGSKRVLIMKTRDNKTRYSVRQCTLKVRKEEKHERVFKKNSDIHIYLENNYRYHIYRKQLEFHRADWDIIIPSALYTQY